MEHDNCPHCGKRIEGYTANQVAYLMRQHVVAKHPESVSFGPSGPKGRR